MSFTIAVDFDNTMAVNEYPRVGVPVPGAVEWLHRLQDAGARIILWTMRGSTAIEPALAFCATHGIRIWAVNHNPEQAEWTDSPKAHADLVIDDRTLGCPLVEGGHRGSYVNWAIAGPYALSRVAKSPA